MITASVTDLDRTAAFFREIAGYDLIERGQLDPAEIQSLGLPEGASGEAMVLQARGSVGARIRLVRFDDAGRKAPMRPGSRAWDRGCYWSVMVRARDLEAIYDDAIRLGWWTHTPIAQIAFGNSLLKVVVFQGPDGLQVQAYERLSPPLEGFTPFERISQPFNVMQMTANREAARAFSEDVLGFQRFWFGPAYVDKEPSDMPLGIPRNLTTSVAYKAAIFQPVAGEYGRMEYIEIIGLEGRDYSQRCDAPNLGWLSVTYPVNEAQAAADTIIQRGGRIVHPLHTSYRTGLGWIRSFTVRSPDGALVEFAERIN